MITAINSEGQTVVAHQAYKDEHYYCKLCQEELTLKQGAVRIHHFAHQSRDRCVIGGGESIQHLTMKMMMKNFIESVASPVKSELEKPFNNRQFVADYYCELQYGEDIIPVAVECVYKHTTFKDFSDKYHWYLQHGIKQLWVFHESKTFSAYLDGVRLNEMQKHVYHETGQLCVIDTSIEEMRMMNLKYYKGMWRTSLMQRKGGFLLSEENTVIIPTSNSVFLTQNRNLESSSMERRFETNDVAWKVMSQFDEIKPIFMAKGANGEKDEDYRTYRYDEIEGIYVMSFIPEFKGQEQEPKELICKLGERNSVAYKLRADERFAMLKPGCQIKLKALDYGYNLYVYEDSAEEWLLVEKENEEPLKDPVTALDDYFASIE